MSAAGLLHLTWTGPWAGRPLCGAARGIAGVRYQHEGYGETYRQQLADPELCPACRAESVAEDGGRKDIAMPISLLGRDHHGRTTTGGKP